MPNVSGVWSHVLKWISGKERPAPLGPLRDFGFMALCSQTVRCVRWWRCWEGFRSIGKGRKWGREIREGGWNNYIRTRRLFDLVKMQEKGVSPLAASTSSASHNGSTTQSQYFPVLQIFFLLENTFFFVDIFVFQQVFLLIEPILYTDFPFRQNPDFCFRFCYSLSLGCHTKAVITLKQIWTALLSDGVTITEKLV